MNARQIVYPLLVISLAFNIAVVGMHVLEPMPEPPHGPEFFRDRITRQMDSSDAAIVRAIFDRHHAEFVARKQDCDTAVNEVRKILDTDPLDSDALQKAMDKARQDRSASQEVLEETILDAANKVSPGARKLLVPPPSEGEHGGPPRGDGPHGPPPG